jgi:O6-methylguanine-DNA--protein-cysteine methyltransferase
MKRCPKCGETKPETEFHKSRTLKDGLALYCKRCTNNTSKEYRKTHYKPRKVLTEKQHKVLQYINELYKLYGKFPTYKELAVRTGTTRQDIDRCLNFVLKPITSDMGKTANI